MKAERHKSFGSKTYSMKAERREPSGSKQEPDGSRHSATKQHWMARAIPLLLLGDAGPFDVGDVCVLIQLSSHHEKQIA
jgi:hypothetical protein